VKKPQFLAPMEGAVQWTGRPAGTLWRWAHEGRINRYGHGRGQVRFDLVELEPKSPDGRACPTPPLPAKRAA